MFASRMSRCAIAQVSSAAVAFTRGRNSVYTIELAWRAGGARATPRIRHAGRRPDGQPPSVLSVSDVFKICPLCGQSWATRLQFLEDAGLALVGYQVDFQELSLGLFLFNHRSCQTTLAIRAQSFRDLYDGPVYRDCRTGEEVCPGYCLKPDQLQPCPVECECAWVRALLGIIRDWPKPIGAEPPAAAAGLNL